MILLFCRIVYLTEEVIKNEILHSEDYKQFQDADYRKGIFDKAIKESLSEITKLDSYFYPNQLRRAVLEQTQVLPISAIIRKISPARFRASLYYFTF